MFEKTYMMKKLYINWALSPPCSSVISFYSTYSRIYGLYIQKFLFEVDTHGNLICDAKFLSKNYDTPWKKLRIAKFFPGTSVYDPNKIFCTCYVSITESLSLFNFYLARFRWCTRHMHRFLSWCFPSNDIQIGSPSFHVKYFS